MASAKRIQQDAINSGFLDAVGEKKNLFTEAKFNILGKVLAAYGSEFKVEVTKSINEKNIVASGALASDKNIIVEVAQSGSSAELTVRMLNYYDFVNKGVKGVKSIRNAPASPYQFKTLGMNDAGRESLRNYITQGKAKATTFAKYRKLGVEKKGASLMDTQVNTLAYLIKAFGIKARPYFDEVYQKVFADVEDVIIETAGAEMLISLTGIEL